MSYTPVEHDFVLNGYHTYSATHTEVSQSPLISNLKHIKVQQSAIVVKDPFPCLKVGGFFI